MLIPKVLVALMLFSHLPATSPINCYWGSIPSETDAEGFSHHLIRDNYDACVFVWDLQNNTIVFGGLENENGTMLAAGCTETEEWMKCVCLVDLCMRPEVIESYWKLDANVTAFSEGISDEAVHEHSILESKVMILENAIDASESNATDSNSTLTPESL